MSAPGGPHAGQRRTQHVPDAEDLHLEHAPDLGAAGLLDRTQEPVAGVVDHDVDPAETVHGRGDRGGDGPLVGEVEFDRQQPRAVDVVESGGEAFGGAGRGRDIVPLRQQLPDEFEAEAAGGASDKPCVGHGSMLDRPDPRGHG
jgi:hypothetical protein